MGRCDRSSITFRAITDISSSEDEIAPTDLAYALYPKISGCEAREKIIEQSNIIRECTEIVTKMNVFRMLRDVMRSRNCPCSIKIEKIRRLPPGQEVLMYHERESSIVYKMLLVRNNNVDMMFQSGKIASFVINLVRSYDTEQSHDIEEINDEHEMRLER